MGICLLKGSKTDYNTTRELDTGHSHSIVKTETQEININNET